MNVRHRGYEDSHCLSQDLLALKPGMAMARRAQDYLTFPDHHKTSKVKASGENALLEIRQSLMAHFLVLPTQSHSHGSQWQSQYYTEGLQFPGPHLADPTPS